MWNLVELYMKYFLQTVSETVQFKDGVFSILGKNTVGKSTILEAVYYSITEESFKYKTKGELINDLYKNDEAIVQLILVNNQENKTLVLRRFIRDEKVSKRNLSLYEGVTPDLKKDKPIKELTKFSEVQEELKELGFAPQLFKFSAIIGQEKINAFIGSDKKEVENVISSITNIEETIKMKEEVVEDLLSIEKSIEILNVKIGEIGSVSEEEISSIETEIKNIKENIKEKEYYKKELYNNKANIEKDISIINSYNENNLQIIELNKLFSKLENEMKEENLVLKSHELIPLYREIEVNKEKEKDLRDLINTLKEEKQLKDEDRQLGINKIAEIGINMAKNTNSLRLKREEVESLKIKTEIIIPLIEKINILIVEKGNLEKQITDLKEETSKINKEITEIESRKPNIIQKKENIEKDLDILLNKKESDLILIDLYDSLRDKVNLYKNLEIEIKSLLSKKEEKQGLLNNLLVEKKSLAIDLSKVNEKIFETKDKKAATDLKLKEFEINKLKHQILEYSKNNNIERCPICNKGHISDIVLLDTEEFDSLFSYKNNLVDFEEVCIVSKSQTENKIIINDSKIETETNNLINLEKEIQDKKNILSDLNSEINKKNINVVEFNDSYLMIKKSLKDKEILIKTKSEELIKENNLILCLINEIKHKNDIIQTYKENEQKIIIELEKINKKGVILKNDFSKLNIGFADAKCIIQKFEINKEELISLEKENLNLSKNKENGIKVIESLDKDINTLGNKILNFEESLNITILNKENLNKNFIDKLNLIKLTLFDFELYSKKELKGIKEQLLIVTTNLKTLNETNNKIPIEIKNKSLENTLETYNDLNESIQETEELLKDLYKNNTSIAINLSDKKEKYNKMKIFRQSKNDLEKEFIELKDFKETLDNSCFPRYVKSFYLAEILKKANESLKDFFEARYELTVDEELNLFAIDKTQGNILRSLSGLSGAERVVVSLSISFALSETLSKIGFIFIDEAHSALHKDMLYYAYEDIKKFAKSGKQVGIVTHNEGFSSFFEKTLVINKGCKASWANSV